jgi:hypothetical protein
MSTAKQCFQTLMGSQLEALARAIAQKYPDVDASAAIQLAQEHAEALDLGPIETPKKAKRQSKAKGPIAPENQCQARVWRSGSGKDQCSLRKCDHLGHTDYCKRHAKQADISEDACTRGDDGYSHKGLWFGRVDRDIPWLDATGVIAIEWDTAEHKQLVADAVSSGDHLRHTRAKTYKGPKKSTKKLKKKLKVAQTPSTVGDVSAVDTLSTLLAVEEQKTAEDVVAALAQTVVAGIMEQVLEPVEVDAPSAVVVEASQDLEALLSDEDELDHLLDGDDDEQVDQVEEDNSPTATQAQVVVEESSEIVGDIMTDKAGKKWFVQEGCNTAWDPDTEESVGKWDAETQMVSISDC